MLPYVCTQIQRRQETVLSIMQAMGFVEGKGTIPFWEFVYFLFTSLTTLLLTIPMAQSRGHDSPLLLLRLAGTALLVWLSPVGLPIMAALYIVLLAIAPASAIVIATAWVLAVATLAVLSIFRRAALSP